MKKVAILFTILLANISISHASDAELKMDGAFRKIQTAYNHGLSLKDCHLINGRLHKDICVIKHAGSTVKIQKRADGYLVDIKNVGSNGQTCNFEGLAQPLNPVQLLAQKDQCEVTVGFTDPNTMSVWNNGLCQNFCGPNMSLQINGIKRIHSKK